jgi:DNA-binding NarL/FixJ family response regulator
MTQAGLDIPTPFLDRITRVTNLATRIVGHAAFESARGEGRADPSSVIAVAGVLPASESARSILRGGRGDLTPREIDVLRSLVRGLTDKEIAAELGIGVRTVGTHVAAIRAKLDVPSRGAAIAVAVRDDLIPD